MKDAFGVRIPAQTYFVEPIWKMILSNKGILPILWEIAPNHRNLLPAYFDEPKDLGAWAKKPLLGREGSNITLHAADGREIKQEGTYDAGRYIYQQLCEIKKFDNKLPLMGVWIIGGDACGLGVREDELMITTNRSRFVPHYIAT